MRDLFPKFIIETDDEQGNCLILSKCTYHKDLAIDKEKVRGGGFFKYNSEDNSFTFSGESHDFGRASQEDIQKAVDEDKVFTNPYMTRSIAKKHKFFYDTGSELLELNIMAKKTAKISFGNLKDPDGWNELIHELKWEKFQAEHPDLDEDELCEKFYTEVVSKTFEYGEYGSIEIEVDEDLNIIGGKVFSCGK